MFVEHQISDKSWTPMIREKKTFTIFNGEFQIIREQFPFSHRNATTIHMTQSLSLDEGVINFEGRPQPGLHYVALSRFKTTRNLSLQHFSPLAIRQDRKVHEEMARLRKECTLCIYPKPLRTWITPNKLTLVFQNVRSFPSHQKDFESIPGIQDVDLICLNETHLLSTPPNVQLLPNCIFAHNKKGGILISSKLIAVVLQVITTDHIDIVKFSYHGLIFIFLYRHPFVPLNEFELTLLELISGHENDKVIIFGDFNLQYNVSTHEVPGCSFLKKIGFSQIITFPTNVDSTNTIDHVWINSSYPNVEPHFLSTYFSDHFPIVLSISL